VKGVQLATPLSELAASRGHLALGANCARLGRRDRPCGTRRRNLGFLGSLRRGFLARARVLQFSGKPSNLGLCTCEPRGKRFGVSFPYVKIFLPFRDDGVIRCVAAFELVNCQSCQAQVTGKVQSINIDKTDGAQIYISEASVGASIVTAKSSEMNVLFPGGPDGDFIELAVPEQFVSKFDPSTKGLVTTQTDIAG
jgi:hypothetical protein